MDTTLLTAIIGAGGALLGSVIGGISTFIIQSKLLDNATDRQIAIKLQDRRLDALQNLLIAIDVVVGNVGKTEGGEVGKLFGSIVHELPKHIPFLPPDLREKAQDLLHQFFTGSRTGEMKVLHKDVMHLKNSALRAIDDLYMQSQTANK